MDEDDWEFFEPFERLIKHLQDVQSDFDRMHSGLRRPNDDGDGGLVRTNLPNSFQVALGGIEYTCGLLKDLERLQTKFSDVTIKVNGRKFKGHRCVLAAASGFFEVMFSSGFKERDATEVELKGMDGAIFEKIFDFIYSGRMDLCPDTWVPAFHAAAYLELSKTERIFTDFIITALESDLIFSTDLLSILSSVEEHGMTDLSKMICSQLLRNFEGVVESDEFVQNGTAHLIREYLKNEIKSFGLYFSEEQLLDSIIRWLKHDWMNRKGDAYEFLKKIRLGLIPKDKVQQLIDAQILEIPECKKMMDDLVENWTQYEGVEDPMNLPEELLPRNMRRTLIAFGGQRQKERDYFYDDYRNHYDPDYDSDADEIREEDLFGHYYHKDSQKWRPLSYPDMPGDASQLEYSSVVVVDRDIYLAGGRQSYDDDDYDDDDDGDDKKDDISRQLYKINGNVDTTGKAYYHQVKYRWEKLPRMKQHRFGFALLHHEGFLYAIGGQGLRGQGNYGLGGVPDTSCFVSSVERFSLQQQKWGSTNPLPDPLIDTSAVVIDGKILVYGLKGPVDTGGEYCLVSFDPSTKTWSKHLTETYAVQRGTGKPILLVHEGACYRVWYEKDESASSWRNTKYIPHVNHIKMKQGASGTLQICLGSEIKGQGAIPSKKAVAFHINGHVYVNVGGYAHKTGAILDDPNSGVESLNGWDECCKLHRFKEMDHKYVVEYTYDTKKML